MDTFEVGDKVRVVLPGSRRNNHTGTVVTAPSDTGRMVVQFPDNGDGWWVYPDQLERLQE